jgi:Bifunctional DNA primase/polymerase, N-terminal/Primase C terminal 1 (PriCT-1)
MIVPKLDSASNSFSRVQPMYADHGIVTFPIRDNKRPAISNYQRLGVRGSRELARSKLASLPAAGFMTNARNRITILDVDVPDEKVLADALGRHGPTPLIARTASGKYHGYYKHNGERRRIRPWRDLPIDLLGAGGLAVAPPSQIAKGSYEFIQGSLDDLDKLPVLRNLDLPDPRQPSALEGERNKTLWRQCMRHAHHVDTFDGLLDVARTFNDNCIPPLEDHEVMSVAQSAWKYTESGRNYFGQHAAWLPRDEVNELVGQGQMADRLDVLGLLTFLRANQGPDATFMCANGLAETFGWSRLRLAEARRRLIELGYLRPLRQAGRGTPALFRWGR